MRMRSAGLFLLVAIMPAGAAEKLKPEELVARHLQSIGPEAARSQVKTRAVTGSAEVTFRLGATGQLKGSAAFFSDGKQARISLNFHALDYPGEQWAFDGERVSVGTVRPGERSALSSFIYHYDVLMREALLGGAFNAGWALLDATGRQAKLSYSGLKKMEGKRLHELRYRARKGSGDLQTQLFFDPETFRHVYSEHRLVQPAGMGRSPTESSSQRDTIYLVQEQFDDFRDVDGLSLPHQVRITFTIEGMQNTFLADWTVRAEKIVQNVAIDPKSFKVQ